MQTATYRLNNVVLFHFQSNNSIGGYSLYSHRVDTIFISNTRGNSSETHAKMLLVLCNYLRGIDTESKYVSIRIDTRVESSDLG